MWETLGGEDEHNIESTHPVFNQLIHRFGSIRGRHLKRQITKQFLLERAYFVLESIDEIAEATLRKKRSETRKRGKGRTIAGLEARADTDAASFYPLNSLTWKRQ